MAFFLIPSIGLSLSRPVSGTLPPFGLFLVHFPQWPVSGALPPNVLTSCAASLTSYIIMLSPINNLFLAKFHYNTT